MEVTSGSHKGRSYEQDRPHLAEVLSANGYAAGGFHSNPFLDGRYGWDRGFDRYLSATGDDSQDVRGWIRDLAVRTETTKALGRWMMTRVGRLTGVDLRASEEPYLPGKQLNKCALDWARTHSGPTFLWIHYMDVHNPWYPREGTVSDELDKSTLTRTFYRARERPDELTDEDRNRLQTAYEGSIQHFDRILSDFLGGIDRVLDQPVVCLTADHGELLGEDGQYFHPDSLDPELIRIPLVFSTASGVTQPGRPASTVDVMPTLCSIADVDWPSTVDGRNLRTEFREREGITENVHFTGDVMYDALLLVREKAMEYSTVLSDLDLTAEKYILSTIHRPRNTDDPNRLEHIITELAADEREVVLPLHPRTRVALKEYGLLEATEEKLIVTEPLGYIDFVHLMSEAEFIVTDSGGIQKEAMLLKVPCITLREETEWDETVETGWNVLVGANQEKLRRALDEHIGGKSDVTPYGDGNAAESICDILVQFW